MYIEIIAITGHSNFRMISMSFTSAERDNLYHLDSVVPSKQDVVHLEEESN